MARAFVLDVKRVASLKVWLFINMGFTLYVAVLGVYAYWGPKAGRQLFFSTDDKSSSGQADLAFGGVTVLTGAVLAPTWCLSVGKGAVLLVLQGRWACVAVHILQHR